MTKRTLLQSGLLSATLAASAFAASDAEATRSVLIGGAVNHVYMVRETDYSTYTNKTFTDVAGANITFTVPAGQIWAVSGSFSSETDCTATVSNSTGWCSARMVISKNGGTPIEMRPDAGLDFAFATVVQPGGDSGYIGTSFSRSYRTIGPGTFTVQVQAAGSSNIILRLDDWQFQVLTAKQ